MSAPRGSQAAGAAPRARKPLDAKKLAVRGILVAAYIGLALLMLFTGRSHIVLIDNKDAPDGSWAAVDGMAVSVDGQESAEYYPGDRDKAVVKGQRHRIKVELLADQKVVEKSFTVPFGEAMVILSVPKMLKGLEPFVERFEPLDQAPPPEESIGAGESTGFESPQASGLPPTVFGVPAPGAPAAP